MQKKKGSIAWTLPGKKKPFRYGTVAGSELIEILAKRYNTTWEIYDNVTYDIETKEVLRYFIEHGYGNKNLRDYLE